MKIMTAMLAGVLALCSVTSSAADAPGLSLPPYERLQLDNGATVLLMRKPDVPLIAAQVLVRGGALADATGKDGTAAILADLLAKGAGGRDALQYAQAIDGVRGR